MNAIYPIIDEDITSDETFILIYDNNMVNLNKNNTRVWTTIDPNSSKPINSYLSTESIYLINIMNHSNVILIYSFNYKNSRSSFLYRFTSVKKHYNIILRNNEFLLHSYDNPIEL